ncbi:hypothetical protein, partial [Streptomyces millisiae]
PHAYARATDDRHGKAGHRNRHGGKVIGRWDLLKIISFNSKGHPTVGHWPVALDDLNEVDTDALVFGNLRAVALGG